MNDTTQQLRMSIYASLLAALMAAGAQLAVPIGPVPIVLQNMFVFLAPLLLGWRWGLAAVAVYLLAGAVGLPVFAGGTGGIGRFAGPTGGYLAGYLPAALVVGLVCGLRRAPFLRDVLAMVLGSAVLYACGLAWLKLVTAMPWGKVLAVGMLPFLAGDGLKIVAAAAIAKSLRPILRIGQPAAAAAAGGSVAEGAR